ncbi:MAG: HU family DNA-binding protein [Nitrospinae bacterium]|nr:HU family DNA-binding protein [Nitrospinota bacterium]
MNRIEVAAEVHCATGMTVKKADVAVLVILATIGRELASDRPVLIRGFGAFRSAKKKARMGRNPRTGEPAVVKPRTVVRFKASKALKQAVNDAHPIHSGPAALAVGDA